MTLSILLLVVFRKFVTPCRYMSEISFPHHGTQVEASSPCFRSSHSSEWRCVLLPADLVGAAAAEMAAGQRAPGSLLCWCHQKET